MTSEKGPDEIYREWTVAKVALQSIIEQTGLAPQDITGRDIPRGPMLDPALLEEVDRLEREARELYQAWRASMEREE